MLTKEDLECLDRKGISEDTFNEQLQRFQEGFPYMKVERAAVVGDGISVIEDDEKSAYLDGWKSYLAQSHDVVKFVPASGAASRMFKSLYAFLDSEGELTDSEKTFFDRISDFAFYSELNAKCKRNEGREIFRLLDLDKQKTIVENLLTKKGLNYGFLPKGLLLFHNYQEAPRTPFEEHMVEGALYAKDSKGKIKLHFTVSNEHLPYFKSIFDSKNNFYAYRFGADYDVSFSVQKPSTDTIAVDMNNNPFRSNGELLFRPGGHGALIENLNSIDADIIFIKNIDNVTLDAYKQATIEYKSILAGLLIKVQKKIFEFQAYLDSDDISDDQIQKMLNFCETTLSVSNRFNPMDTRENKIAYLKMILNRPLRVCGMVKNEGEPGGGPFLCQNPNGTVSAQILESSQFDLSDETQKEILNSSTHFNPVDLVCAVKNYRGEKYDLTKFIDGNTGFISYKSKDGKELKALELPGLWNGAMSDWNTLFVEVPIDTFTPVKVMNDLLRPVH
ncbi:MAG: DUF4301 family protein, partial [Paludibacteraceae bacterium]|nr:DUF4301 family protein [Paludibacteraceae bacterium]